MKLNHLDLQTTDVQALAAFFVDHFDLQRRSNDRSPAIAILGDEAGFTLVIQRHTAPVYPRATSGSSTMRPRRCTRTAIRLIAMTSKCSPIDINNRGTPFISAVQALLIEVSTPQTAC